MSADDGRAMPVPGSDAERGRAHRRPARADDARGEGRADARASGSRSRRCSSTSRAGSTRRRPRQHFGHGHGLGQVGRPSDAGGGRTRARDGRAHQRHPEVLRRASRGSASPSSSTRSACTATRRRKATSFPQPIGLGATFDPGPGRAAVRDDGRRGAGARHAPGADAGGGRGARSALGPRRGDVRRGPVPGRAAGRGRRAGLPGRRAPSRDSTHVIATLKHYAAHGQPESGTNCAPVNVSMRVLRETFLSTFKAAVQEGGALSVMPSYNEIDGVPSHANRWLLEDVLRGEWGFRGFTVSDYFAIRELHETTTERDQPLRRPRRPARRRARRAGRRGHRAAGSGLLSAPGRAGARGHDPGVAHRRSRAADAAREVPAGTVRRSVRRSRRGRADRRATRHRALALEAAQQDDHAAQERRRRPAARRAPAAAHRRHRPERRPRDARRLQRRAAARRHGARRASALRAPAGVEVLYHEGCKITIGGSWQQDEVTRRRSGGEPPQHPRGGRRGGAGRRGRARHRRQRADVARGVGREPPRRPAQPRPGRPAGRAVRGRRGHRASRSSCCCSAGGRRRSATSPSRRPRFSSCWYLGQETGTRRGRACCSATSIPAASCRSRSRARSATCRPTTTTSRPRGAGYLFDSVAPLFPFGFGLSYTTFALRAPPARAGRRSARATPRGCRWT